MFRILFHREKCIGCNACVEAAPDRWRVSKRDGRCNLIGGQAKKGIYQAVASMEEYDRNLEAASNCPVKVIQVTKLRQ